MIRFADRVSQLLLCAMATRHHDAQQPTSQEVERGAGKDQKGGRGEDKREKAEEEEERGV